MSQVICPWLQKMIYSIILQTCTTNTAIAQLLMIHINSYKSWKGKGFAKHCWCTNEGLNPLVLFIHLHYLEALVQLFKIRFYYQVRLSSLHEYHNQRSPCPWWGTAWRSNIMCNIDPQSLSSPHFTLPRCSCVHMLWHSQTPKVMKPLMLCQPCSHTTKVWQYW